MTRLHAVHDHVVKKSDATAYTGPVIHAINYAPTWQGWNPKTQAFFDSDFANDGMAGLWGAQGRNDLGKIAADGFNVVRLYDWSPSRSDNGGTDNAHLNFLNYAYSLKPDDGYSQHLMTIVPVGAYFLSNDKYAWSQGNGKRSTPPTRC